MARQASVAATWAEVRSRGRLAMWSVATLSGVMASDVKDRRSA